MPVSKKMYDLARAVLQSTRRPPEEFEYEQTEALHEDARKLAKMVKEEAELHD